ncbi:MAG: alanine racemase [Actinobacteria bacterium]|nr:alanine racemase [Actinomycetota bacterium]
MEYRRGAWADVDLGAIARNVRALKALTPPATAFMAVVKADGYGHGALEVARAAVSAGADRLGVATLEEAIALREAGVRAPLHVLAEVPADGAPLVVEHGIIATVATREVALALSRAATDAQRAAVGHLKVDTGMNRIGVRAEEAGEFGAWVANLPGVELEGVFTHFATADTPGDWEFDRQVERFRVALESLRTEGVRPRLAHTANSAATILHPQTHLDMVRCGISVYGLHPSEATRGKIALDPAMSVKASLSFVKRVGLGDGVSYGLTWHAGGPATIATLPLGYADGVHRVLSGRMSVLIGGRRCVQVGRICMDQLMVEVPPGVDAHAGDEAVLVGTQGTECIGMDEVADLAGTINYELACGFALRLERRYSR